MRMRKVPWAVEYLPQAQHLIKEPAALAGKWKDKLPGQVLHLELGAGKGKYSLDMAKKYPDEAFIAVEKNESAAGIAAKKYDEHNDSQNLALIYGDAIDAGSWFVPGEVDVIHLNFSDPWPKKRNAKRRLSSHSFIDNYKTILAPGGRIEMKTDNKDLFEYSVVEFSQAGFVIAEISVDYRRIENEKDAMTEYEQKFVEEGQPIYRVVLKKRAENE